MNETKHTPGPWFVECVSDAVRIFVKLTKRSGIGQTKVILARLAPPQLPEAETHANARLMAAAPELLEACRFIKAHLDSLESALPENDPLRVARRYYHAPLHAKLDAAIAKAEGGS